MSCGFPDPSLKIAIPFPDIPEPPGLPPIPDYSASIDLGLNVKGSLSLAIPSPDIPEPPALPTIPTYSPDLGLNVNGNLSLAIPSPDIPEPPALPLSINVACPYEDRV